MRSPGSVSLELNPCHIPKHCYHGFMMKTESEIRAAALNEAIEAARTQDLLDDLDNPEDEAYQKGVSDAVAAIRALLEGK